MPKAVWNDRVIAEASVTEIQNIEGNVYFPRPAVRQDFLRPSDTNTHCGWKGIASYYDVVVDGKVNEDAAWYYPAPSEKAAHIKDFIAFWHGVKVEE